MNSAFVGRGEEPVVGVQKELQRASWRHRALIGEAFSQKLVTQVNDERGTMAISGWTPADHRC